METNLAPSKLIKNYVPTSGAREGQAGFGAGQRGSLALAVVSSIAVVLAWWQREPLRAFLAGLKHSTSASGTRCTGGVAFV